MQENIRGALKFNLNGMSIQNDQTDCLLISIRRQCEFKKFAMCITVFTVNELVVMMTLSNGHVKF